MPLMVLSSRHGIDAMLPRSCTAGHSAATSAASDAASDVVPGPAGAVPVTATSAAPVPATRAGLFAWQRRRQPATVLTGSVGSLRPARAAAIVSAVSRWYATTKSGEQGLRCATARAAAPAHPQLVTAALVADQALVAPIWSQPSSTARAVDDGHLHAAAGAGIVFDGHRARPHDCHDRIMIDSR